MQDDFQSFSLEISSWGDLLGDQVQKVKCKIALDILRGVVGMTPVKIGTARGNWQVTNGDRPRVGITLPDKDGNRTILRGAAVIGRVGVGESIWIHNNLPYIGALERGHSGRAPHGMLRVTLNSVEGMFR